METITFSECKPITGSEPLRQGDVFYWNAESKDPWRIFGLIVTADCDIARSKHYGTLSYVPVLRLRDFLRLFIIPAELDKAFTNVRDETFALLRSLQTENTAFNQPISDDVAKQWILETNTSEILGELRIERDKDRARLSSLLALFRQKYAVDSSSDYKQCLDALLAVKVHQGSTPEKVTEHLSNKIEKLPGDFFFLRSLSNTHRDCYVACLRHIRELHERDIAIRPKDKASTSATRFAGLTAPYLYCLTQRLGSVFSDIGLPSRYEDSRREARTLILDRLNQ